MLNMAAARDFCPRGVSAICFKQSDKKNTRHQDNRLSRTGLQQERDAEFQHAVDQVKRLDIAILVLGEAQNMSGERASRSTLTLPGRQQELLEAAVATGKPVVLVLLNSRSLDIPGPRSMFPPFWKPGTRGRRGAPR